MWMNIRCRGRDRSFVAMVDLGVCMTLLVAFRYLVDVYMYERCDDCALTNDSDDDC